MPWRHHENKPEMEEFEGVPQQRGLAGLGLHMGQGQSSPQVGEAGSSNVAAHIASKTFAIGSAAASSTGKNIKRAFNVRRKKPPSLAPDEIAAFAEPASSSKKTLNAFGAGKLPANPVSDSSVPVVSDEPAEYSEPHQSTPAPAPAPPPKPVPSPPASSSQHAFPNRGSSLSHTHPPPPQVQRASIIPMTPGISHAVRYMRQGEGNSPDSPQFGLTSAKEEERDEKENWRKSDSTISHRTIRPAAGMGSRTPRPGSIVTPLPEDDDLSSVEDSSSSSSYSHFNQSRPSLGTRNDSSSTWPSQELGQPVYPHRQSGETPSLSKAAAEGFIGPSSNGFQSTSNNIRGRLAAWTTTTKNVAPASTDAHPHHKGSSSIASQTSLDSSNGGNAPRSTSISNGFGPAAGFAKRAVEKMGRALGGMSSASSGYSSSDSSSNPPSSFHGGGMLTRTDSDTSSGVDHKGKHGRTPNAPSGAWSIASSTNTGASSESDLPSGPFLGDMLRPPIQPEGGVVFGRALSSVVQRTPPVPVQHHPRSTEELVPGLNEKIVAIGQRMIPAVAARSAQHVMLWGIEEEGLFRVNGRPSHVNKLRSEFDTGADYNMSRCSPGELDPHAVAGVFKAFLRELPEPLLTRGLMPYFDAAMQQESNRNESNTSSSSATAKARGPGLPSGPRAGIPLRKPPSLSTLAMPNLQGLKSASPELIKALRSLISKLPQENKDLLLTVVDLIKATASQYRVTKMPLSNLLLVFCPSLHMSPPLLRTLAECDALWQDQQVPIDEVPETPTPGGRAAEPVEQREPLSDPSTDPFHVSPPETSFDTSDVLDIRRQTLVLDIKAATEPREGQKQSVGEALSPSKPFVGDSGPKITTSGPSPSDELVSPVSPSIIVSRGVNIPRPMGPRKASSPNLSRPSTATSGGPKDLAPALSTSPSQSDMEILDALKDASSAPSSSAESLLTPSSSNSPVSRRSLDDSFTKHPSPSAPVISVLSDEPTSLDLSNPRRPAISGPIGPPVHFPTMSVPTTPQSASSKRSFTGTSTPSSPSSTRMKRPSLTLLFKRSNPSLTSTSPRPIISNPIPQSADSEGSRSLPNPTPIVAAPPTLPPVLNANMDGFGTGLDLDFSSKSPTTGTYPNPVQPAPVWIESSPSSNTVELPMRSTTPTPIADLYSSASSSSVSLASSSSNEPYPLPQVTHLRLNPGRARQPVQPIVEDSKHADLRLPIQEDEYDDDWTNTVLLAADVDWSSIPTRS